MLYALQDDFTGGIPISAGAMGESGWSINSTADAGHVTGPIAGEVRHPGIYKISCAPIANSILSVCRAKDDIGVLINPYIADDVSEMIWVVRPLSSSNERLLVGLARDPIGATATVLNGGSDGVYAFFDPALSANWRLVTRSAGVQSQVDTGVAVTASQWYVMAFQHVSGGNWRLNVLAGGSQASVQVATNLPSGGVSPTATVQSTTASARVLHVDYCHILPLNVAGRSN
jgi:hypothetical protein